MRIFPVGCAHPDSIQAAAVLIQVHNPLLSHWQSRAILHVERDIASARGHLFSIPHVEGLPKRNTPASSSPRFLLPTGREMSDLLSEIWKRKMSLFSFCLCSLLGIHPSHRVHVFWSLCFLWSGGLAVGVTGTGQLYQ